jgi:photosystem II stability/assembly factor-like uncharacterized protein
MKRAITLLHFNAALLLMALPFAAASRGLDTFGRPPNLLGVPAPYRFANYCAPNKVELWTVGGKGVVLFLEGGRPTRRFKLESDNPFNGDLYGVYFNNGGVGWVVGDSGVIFHSPDRGNTWVEQSVGGEDDFNAVTCTDDEHCWAVGENGLLMRTDDGGRAWKRLRASKPGDLNAVEFLNNKTGWVVGDNGLVLRTKDGGETWDSLRVQFSCEPRCDKWDAPLLSVRFVNERLGWVASHEHIARSTDGGVSWEVIDIEGRDPVVSLIGIASPGDRRVWAVNEGAYNFFSENAGLTWQRYTIK